MEQGQLHHTLNRSVKMALDTGEAATLADAERMFEGYQLNIEVGSRVTNSPTLQAAVLTAVNTGRRCFLGGVRVTGESKIPLLVPWLSCRTLDEAIRSLQGQVGGAVNPTTPTVAIGGLPRGSGHDFAVRVTFDGWSAGVVPVDEELSLPEQQEFTPAGVLGGALAVSEAFQFVRGDNTHAGRRSVGFSLWRPEQSRQWWQSEPGPTLTHLPSRLWLIGLGHLGQAYLWTLGFLPYAQPNDLHVTLQDFDRLVAANDSTSLLTSEASLGQKKTRAMAAWCEQRGFQSTIVERLFASNFQVGPDEPGVALCGVDNREARATLEAVGYQRIIEAGLGNGPDEYSAFQLHTFPASKSAASRWGTPRGLGSLATSLLGQPAYGDLAQAGFDQCGLTELAGRSVGAAFVGAATSAFVVAETLRIVLGDTAYEVIDGTMHDPLGLTAIRRTAAAELYNPGITRAASPTGE